MENNPIPQKSKLAEAVVYIVYILAILLIAVGVFILTAGNNGEVPQGTAALLAGLFLFILGFALNLLKMIEENQRILIYHVKEKQ